MSNNAIDGETLYIRGMEVTLFGIDAIERNQICQNKIGKDYRCGQRAAQASQEIIQTDPVIFLPIVNLSPQRLLVTCESTSKSYPATIRIATQARQTLRKSPPPT